MKVSHLEFLVEEPSAEAFLRSLLPRLADSSPTFDIKSFQGKADLLQRLPDRLRGYASWMPEDWRIILLVDRDRDDCRKLKNMIQSMAASAGLLPQSTGRPAPFRRFISRIAVEELEAWYFGDWDAVLKCYAGVSRRIPSNAKYRDPDAIAGGTWEEFERILKRAGHFKEGIRKIEAARRIGEVIDPEKNKSASFRTFVRSVKDSLNP
jgi:hypothetical protein